MQKAVVLLSGGMDSATAAAIAGDEGFCLYALTFDYGQKNRYEIECAKAIAVSLGADEHKIIKTRLPGGGSAILKGGKTAQTYVPARNTIFLSYAVNWAESLSARDIFIGVNVVDYSGYPDCREEYIKAFEKTANLGTKAALKGKKFKIHTPLMHLSKAGIIKRGISLGLDYSLTSSCYFPARSGSPCGRCQSCLLRQKGFTMAGLSDPARK